MEEAYLSSRSRRHRTKSRTTVRDSNSSLRDKVLVPVGWRRIERNEHFNFAGIIFTSWIGTSSGRGSVVGGGCTARPRCSMATAIPFVPFRSEIAYNVEIKRLAVLHDRRKSRARPERSLRDMEISQSPPILWHGDSIFGSRTPRRCAS